MSPSDLVESKEIYLNNKEFRIITFSNFTAYYTNELFVSENESAKFFITLDTSVARNGDTLGVSLPSDGMVWSDGATITNETKGLPLEMKEIRYY